MSNYYYYLLRAGICISPSLFRLCMCVQYLVYGMSAWCTRKKVTEKENEKNKPKHTRTQTTLCRFVIHITKLTFVLFRNLCCCVVLFVGFFWARKFVNFICLATHPIGSRWICCCKRRHTFSYQTICQNDFVLLSFTSLRTVSNQSAFFACVKNL